jgi:hypothetical protein
MMDWSPQWSRISHPRLVDPERQTTLKAAVIFQLSDKALLYTFTVNDEDTDGLRVPTMGSINISISAVENIPFDRLDASWRIAPPVIIPTVTAEQFERCDRNTLIMIVWMSVLNNRMEILRIDIPYDDLAASLSRLESRESCITDETKKWAEVTERRMAEAEANATTLR